METKQYRGYTVVEKRDLPAGGVISNGKRITQGVVVVKDGTNAMPGATWFNDASDAILGIDVLLAVDGDADLFWEIMQPFDRWPGHEERVMGGNGSIQHGRFRASVVDGKVASVAIKPRALTAQQFVGLMDLLANRPELGRCVFSLGLQPPAKIGA